MSQKDLDGLEKNLSKMKAAEKRLKTNPRMVESRGKFKKAKFFSTGKDNFFHRWLDLHTETARAEPYYYVHWILYYRIGPMLLVMGAMAGALAYLVA